MSESEAHNGLIAIPCHGESATIAAVVSECRQHLPDRVPVVVVDDGSTDDTAAHARSAGARVIRHDGRQGKGAAVQTAARIGFESGCRWIITMDGDGQHLPSELDRFLPREPFDGPTMVVGNRFAEQTPGAHPMPRVRRLTNLVMSRLLSRLARSDWPDTQCGFRRITLDHALFQRLQTRRFETESEQLIQAHRLGWTIDFVPASCVYHDGPSRIHAVTDTLRWCRWLLATWARSGATRHEQSGRSITEEVVARAN